MRAPVVPTFIPQRPRRSLGGGALSVFLHGLLIFAIVSPWLRRYYTLSDDPSGLPGIGGGGGSGGERYIALAALRPAARPAPAPVEPEVVRQVVQPPTIVPTEIPPPVPEDTTPKPPEPSTTPSDGAAGAAAAGTAGTGGGSGGGSGGGQGPGTGSGAGPGTGGSLRGTAPKLRGLVMPPNDGTPRELRGKDLTFRVFVGTNGRVERYEVFPAVNDRGFRRKLDDIILGYNFYPAKDSTGQIVPGVTTVTMTLFDK
jgi:hypothetical protein